MSGKHSTIDEIIHKIRIVLSTNVLDTNISSELYNLEYKLQNTEINHLEDKIYNLVNELGSNMNEELKRKRNKLEKEKTNRNEILELEKEFLLIMKKINN